MVGPNTARAEPSDPVDAAFEAAEPDDRPATDEEAEALRASRAEVEAGAPLVPHEEAMRGARARFAAE